VVNPEEFEGCPTRRTRLLVANGTYPKTYFDGLFDPTVLAVDTRRLLLRGFAAEVRG